MSWQKSAIRCLESVLEKPVTLISTASVGGGDINEAFLLHTGQGDYFVKKNSASLFPGMFEKEAKGLELLRSAHEIDVPEVIACGEEHDVAFLILKFIESSDKKRGFWEDFGKRLAALHRHTNHFFGLEENNYIGSLHQSNRKHDNWSDFFREERIQPQMKLAFDQGRIDYALVQSFERFYNRLNELFPVEPPALLHGDLWGGNFMVDASGEPVLIDPAVYYGHREMDLAMSQLFGGFGPGFYESYHSHFPLEKGWKQRLDFCNLYPLMVHVNLFGGGYVHSVKSILNKF